MSLSQKIFKGSILNLFEYAVRVIAMLVVTPILVSYLGMERYGIWLILTAAVSFLGLLDGGITLSGTRFYARSLGGRGDRELILGTLRWLYKWIGILCVVVTGLLILFIPWLINDLIWRNTGRLVILSLGGITSLRFFFRIHLVVLKAHLRYDLIVFSALVKIIVQSVLVVILLVNGYGLIVLALAQTISDILDQLMVVLFSKQTDSCLNTPARCNAKIRNDILGYSAMAFLQMIGQYLRSRIDPFVIATFISVNSVPIYNMASRLVTLFDDIINAALGGTLLAGFSQVEGQSGVDGLRHRFFFSLRFSVALALMGGTGLFVLGPAFLVAWLGDRFSESGELIRILAIPATLKLMQYPSSSLLYSTNKHHLLTKLTFGAGIFNSLISIILTSAIGISGVVLATFIEMSIFYILFMPKLASSSINVSLIDYYKALMNPSLKIMLPLLIWALAVKSLVAADFVSLALAILSLFFVGGVSSFWLLFNKQERNKLCGLIKF